jgi:hypothetical protein
MIKLRQGCKKISLSLVTQFKRFLRSLRDEAMVKDGVYLPRTKQQSKYGNFQVQKMMLVPHKTMNLQKIG